MSSKQAILRFAGLGIAALSQLAFGQNSVSATSIVGYIPGPTDYINSIDQVSVSDNSLAYASVNNLQFNGMDGSGNPQTMTFSGWTASQSDYGQLHNSTSVTITNNYYNPANPEYDGTSGSPFSLDALGFSFFTDQLQFGGVALQNGYSARYLFHIDGTVTGNLTENVGSDLGVTIAGNNEAVGWFGNGTYDTTYATQSYMINGNTPQLIQVQFSSQDYADMPVYADGSNLSGEADFQNTLTLSGIQVLDPNGNVVVGGWTVSSMSGTSYPMATPEPAPFAVLGLGGLVLLRRRRKG